jgi:hypothetical protein
MMIRALLFALAGLTFVGAAVARTWEPVPGVIDPQQAHIDYMLKCQGCHRPDGSGDEVSNPPMNGKVARFLSVPGGRQFLGQVPGVATVDLDDARLANLLNWTLYRFDSANIPADFQPYSAEEIADLRKSPLRIERLRIRGALVAKMRGGKL